jgi:endonuclease YncB( thermonuclease family)
MHKPHAVHATAWRAPSAGAGRRRRPDYGVLGPPLAATFIALLAFVWLNAGVPIPDAVKRVLQPTAAISVVDGNTIRIDGKLTRLAGFSAPDTWKPACPAEQRLGETATARLRTLVAGGAVSFARVGCTCAAGTEGTAECGDGGACGSLRVDGRDVGDILVSEGLAVPSTCTGGHCPATPKPWCG